MITVPMVHAVSGFMPSSYRFGRRALYELGNKSPQFSIKQREADLYVFAWHPVQDAEIADHRRPDQWEFFVVAEENLPQKKQAIGLEALTRLCDVCNYDALAARVVKVLESIESSFKADLPG